tara:strand:- start:196 stop:441 length:246 start_codon:yes stop_codon:yes gene_type:complete
MQQDNIMINTMSDQWRFDMLFTEAVDVVHDFGGEDLLKGMEKIKVMRSDNIYDEDDFKKRVHLVNAYHVVSENMNKIFFGM